MVKKIQLTREELLVHLNENLDFLKCSAEWFDSGYTAEAKRLAVTVRVLVHDTGKSKSILNLLKVKSNMVFLDTVSDCQPKNLMSHHGLVGISVGGDKGGSFFHR